MNNYLPVEILKAIKYPMEDQRFQLALVFCIPLALFFFFFLFFSSFVLVVSFFSVLLLLWCSQKLAQAYLVANAIKVSKHNFPEILQIVDQVKETINYDRDIQIFIVEEGTVNAGLAKFFQIKYIILHSSMVEDMLSSSSILQLKWVIARFVGTLKMKQLRLDLFKIMLESIDNFKVFGLFIYSYERAVQFTGDNIGLTVCGDLNEALSALDKFLVGNKLSKRVKLAGIIEQGLTISSSIFATILRVFSNQPHVIDRYLNLLSFAKEYFPEQYQEYLLQLDHLLAKKAEDVIPYLYKNQSFITLSQYSKSKIKLNFGKITRKEVRDRIKISKIR